MATIIEVVIESVEALLVVVAECSIGEGEMCRDARMIEIVALAVAHEQHILDELVQSVAQCRIGSRVLTGKCSLHLTLRVVFGTHAEGAVFSNGLQIFFGYIQGTFAEDTLQHPLVDERTCMSFLVKLKSVAAYLCLGHGQSRRELSEQSMYAVHRNVPYTEETEHVVDAVSIEILGHIAESAHPPLTSVGKHTVPVVCRESPVLSVDRECVWRSTCLSVKVEVVRFEPHVASCTVYTDRDVALEYHATGHGMLVCGAHLLVEHELQIVEEGEFLVCLGARI